MSKEKPLIKDEITNGISPSIAECERFIVFLNKKFSLGLPDDIVVNIQDTNKTIKGFFMGKNHPKTYETDRGSLNRICISSYHLKDTPYETLAHEVAHFWNEARGIEDCRSNQYHNKHFKTAAEALLLKVEKSTRGYAYTNTTPEFNAMLKEFKPDPRAFTVFQVITETATKSPNRNLLYECGCGVKIRTARNEDKPLQAICGYCKQPFECKDD